jgi:predicted ATP-grasp superfamily ATP-dependent carboligase
VSQRVARVLVLDSWTRKALSVIRSLGRKGVDVDAASHTYVAAPLYSTYTKRRFLLPHPRTSRELYVESVISLVRGQRYDAVFALEEDSIGALLPRRDEVEAHARFPYPDARNYDIAIDKGRTLERAAALGIPTPKTARPATLAEATGHAQALGFPLVAKPVSGSGARGFRRLNSAAELRAYYENVVPRFGDPILQEEIPWHGAGVGVGSLCRRGRQVVAFSYKRLREFPVRGGPSTLRESTDDAALKDHARVLLESLGWHGVAMVEFKIDPRDGIPKLMEINPRFWGSLELASASGINFPFLLLTIAHGDDVSQPIYSVGVRNRWLIPGDIAHFVQNPERFRLTPSFFDFGSALTSYEDFATDDIPGVVSNIVCTGLSAFRREVWMLGGFR